MLYYLRWTLIVGGYMMGTGKNAKSNINENELRNNIRGLRSSLGLMQEQFAAKISVTFSTVNRWESGKSKPSSLACARSRKSWCVRKEKGRTILLEGEMPS
jgi:putative transcriptional regulator